MYGRLGTADWALTNIARRMKVLLTNDDGIQATGLNALRRALLEVPGVELAVIAPDANRSATARSITTRAPALGGGDRVRGRHRRLSRPTARPWTASGSRRSGCSARARADRVRDQPRRQPRRRHHLLGHGRRRARGIVLGVPAIAVSQQSTKRRDGLPVRARASTSSGGRASSPGWSRSSSERADARRHAAERQLPRGRAEERRRRGRRGSASASTGTSSSSRRRTRAAGAAAATGSTAWSPRYQQEDGHGLRRDRRGHDLGHAAPLRPDRHARLEEIAGWDLDALLGARGVAPRCEAVSAAEAASGPPSCAASSSTTTTATTSSTIRRSRTPSTTTLLRRAARPRGGAPRAAHARLAHPAGRRPSRSSKFEQVRHLQPMLSLANARNEEELRAWEVRGPQPARQARDGRRARSST